MIQRRGRPARPAVGRRWRSEPGPSAPISTPPLRARGSAAPASRKWSSGRRASPRRAFAARAASRHGLLPAQQLAVAELQREGRWELEHAGLRWSLAFSLGRPPIGNRPSAARIAPVLSVAARALYWRSMPTSVPVRLCLRGSQCLAWMPPSTPDSALPAHRRPDRGGYRQRRHARRRAPSVRAAGAAARGEHQHGAAGLPLPGELRRGAEARPKSAALPAPRAPVLPEPMPRPAHGSAVLVNMDQVLQEFLWIVNDPLAVPSFHAPAGALAAARGQAAGADGGGEPAPPRIRLAPPDGRQRRAAPGDRARAVGSGVTLRPGRDRRHQRRAGGGTSRCAAWPRPATPSRWSRPPTSTRCR